MSVLLINKNVLKDNIEHLKNISLKTNCKIIAVVKGNGYGIGLEEYARYLLEEDIDFFAVSSVEEAITLRNISPSCKVLLLTPIRETKELELLIKNNIILTVDSKEMCNVIEALCIELGKTVKVHVKIDTGFSRYGFLYNAIDEIIKTISEFKNIEMDGIYSHFSTSLARNNTYVKLQYTRFQNVIFELEKENIQTGIKHICNSAAFLKYPDMHMDAARIGSAFLGTATGNNIFLKKISYLSTKVIEVKNISKGTYIGYGNTYKAKKETKVAIVPVGYNDGLGMTIMEQRFTFLSKVKGIINSILQLFHKRFETVNIKGKEYKIIGQIGMGTSIVDVSGSDVKEGDEVCINIRPLFVNSDIERKFF